MVWSPFRNIRSLSLELPEKHRRNSAATSLIAQPKVAQSGRSDAGQAISVIHRAQKPQLDAIGSRNEVVRLRISEMTDRLEDLKSLQDDFSSILEPLAAMAEELPRATMRVAEVEALLGQEQEAGSASRREIADLAGRIASAGNDLSTAVAQVQRLEASLRDRDGEIEELRIGLHDKTLLAENLDRQLFSEGEQTKALIGENKALRMEAQAVDQALARAERELTETRERLTMQEQDNRRLQLLSEEQGAKLVELGARHAELEERAEAERQRLRNLEAQLSVESAAREKNEAQYEAEIGAHRAERASLAMKLEAAVNRAGAVDHLLTQVRQQLREKDEAGRTAERNFKEAAIERVTAERRLESVQADLARQTERFIEMQRLRSELDGRCDMLTKALAAKDAQLDQATTRATALSDRIDQVSRRHETERVEFEAANRRLIEELQNERSERALAQGALDISRESRFALQKQHEALKRSVRGLRGNEAGDGAAMPVSESDRRSETSDEDSNIRPFPAPERAN